MIDGTWPYSFLGSLVGGKMSELNWGVLILFSASMIFAITLCHFLIYGLIKVRYSISSKRSNQF